MELLRKKEIENKMKVGREQTLLEKKNYQPNTSRLDYIKEKDKLEISN